MPENFQRRHDTLSGAADLLQMIVGWISDFAYESAMERQLKELEPVIDRALRTDDEGALLFVKFYGGPEGQKVFHGIEFLATGKDPNVAYRRHKSTGGISKSPPRGMLLDQKSSCMVWYQKRSVKVGPAHLSSTIIEWPWYGLIIEGKYPLKK